MNISQTQSWNATELIPIDKNLTQWQLLLMATNGSLAPHNDAAHRNYYQGTF